MRKIIRRKMAKKILPLFLAGAVFISGIPIPAFAAAIPNGEAIENLNWEMVENSNRETDISADDGLINPCMENEDVPAVVHETDLYMEDVEDADVRAHKELRKFMNKYVEPEICVRDDNPQYQLCVGTATKKQLQILEKEAKKVTADAKTQYEKIKALTYFVADRIYYDRVSTIADWYEAPYKVYKYKRTVCCGYAKLMVTLCKLAGIPCIAINGDNHVYNTMYDSDNKKWIFVDASLCSNNEYVAKDQWVKRPPDLSKGFDMTVEYMAFWGRTYMVYNGLPFVVDPKNDCAYYDLATSHKYEEWLNTDNWYLTLAGAKKKNVKASSQIGGYPVRGEVLHGGYNHKTVETLDLSKTKITSIGKSAFFENKKLKKIIFPESLTKIDKFAFNHCDNLETVDISNTELTVIEDSAFADCKKLKFVDLSNTKLKKIMYFAFMNSYALRTIKLPTTLKTICNQAFCTTDRSKKYPLTIITRLPKKKLKLSNKGIWDERKVKVCGAYTVCFVGNKAKSGKMPDLLCGKDRKTALTANKFKRPGYKFVGWSKTKSGKGKIYKNKEKVKNLTKANKTVKLYAIWKK